jgi:hypothetical protein
MLLLMLLVLLFRSGSQEWILIFRHGLVWFGSVRCLRVMRGIILI